MKTPPTYTSTYHRWSLVGVWPYGVAVRSWQEPDGCWLAEAFLPMAAALRDSRATGMSFDSEEIAQQRCVKAAEDLWKRGPRAKRKEAV